MRPYDRKAPFLSTTVAGEQFDWHVGLLTRWRRYTGIDNRDPENRHTGEHVKMSGMEVWQMLAFGDIVGYVPGRPAGGSSASRVQVTEWMWRPVLAAIEKYEAGWVAMTPNDHRIYADGAANQESVATWTMQQSFVAVFTLKPPQSLTDWLRMRWDEAHT